MGSGDPEQVMNEPWMVNDSDVQGGSLTLRLLVGTLVEW